MRNHTTKVGLLAVVVALVVGSAAWGRPPEGDEDLRRDVRTLENDMKRLKQDIELDRREAAAQARRLEERLDRMTLALERLSGTGMPSSRSSLSISPDRRATGTIRLDNRLDVRAQVTIDGILYTIPPRSVRLLRNQPSGAFEYDVTADGFGRANYRSRLGTNETLTVTVY